MEDAGGPVNDSPTHARERIKAPRNQSVHQKLDNQYIHCGPFSFETKTMSIVTTETFFKR